MKFNTLLVMIITLILSACATESITGQETQASQHQPHEMHAEKPRCVESTLLPNRTCSETVTAAFDAQGKLWLVWVDHEHIYLQTSSDQGEHFTDQILVNQQAEAILAHGEYRPKIKFDQQGNIYLTWTQSLEKRYSGHIRFSRSTDGGKSFSQPITINDNQDIIGHRYDALAVGKNGEIIIAWLDARDKEQAKNSQQAFNGSSLYYTWSDNGGKSFYPNQLAAAHSCECCRLGLEITQDNQPVILWREVFDDNIRDHALLKFTDWQHPGQIHRVSHENWKIDACPHHGPALSIANNGVFHAVWFSGASDKQGLYYGRSENAGNTFSQPYAFGAQGDGHPNVFALGQQVAIVWSHFDGKNNVVQLIRSNDQGLTWSPPQEIASSQASVDDAFLLSDGQKLYVSWQTAESYRLIAVDDF